MKINVIGEMGYGHRFEPISRMFERNGKILEAKKPSRTTVPFKTTPNCIENMLEKLFIWHDKKLLDKLLKVVHKVALVSNIKIKWQMMCSAGFYQIGLLYCIKPWEHLPVIKSTEKNPLELNKFTSKNIYYQKRIHKLYFEAKLQEKGRLC